MPKEELKVKDETTSVLNNEKIEPGIIEPLETIVPVSAEETVTLKASELKSMMDDIRDLKGAVSAQKLEESVKSNAPKTLPSAFLKIFMEKIVVGWKSEKAELMYHPSNSNVPVGEVLKATYFFVDGTDSGVIDQVLFTRAEDRVNVSIVEDLGTSVKIRFDSITSSDSTLSERLQMPKDLEPYEIRKDFLNP
jgi:hypothetical protein